jgi:hypothetical protein
MGIPFTPILKNVCYMVCILYALHFKVNGDITRCTGVGVPVQVYHSHKTIGS